LQAAKQLSLTKIIITSTSETYGTAQYVPIDEFHPLSAQSPYAATKIGADSLALSYYHSFNLPVKIVRPFNTYGPRQSARAIIPNIVIQVLSGREELLLGNLAPTRDLTYVKDTVNGFFEIACSGNLFGEVTNIGMNQEISIKDLVLLIMEIIGKSVEIKVETSRVRPENSEVNRLLCNNNKIKSITGWEPGYDLKKGLIETIDWIKNNITIYKTELYNV
jgi:nucleoside-diphosphate-sugar epimerase